MQSRKSNSKQPAEEPESVSLEDKINAIDVKLESKIEQLKNDTTAQIFELRTSMDKRFDTLMEMIQMLTSERLAQNPIKDPLVLEAESRIDNARFVTPIRPFGSDAEEHDTPNPLNSVSNESKGDHPINPPKPPRVSLLEQSIDALSKPLSNAALPSGVTVLRREGRIDDIQLTSADLSEYATWRINVEEYVTQNGVPITLPRIVKKEVRMLVANLNGITLEEINRMDHLKFHKAFVTLNKVSTKQEFFTTLMSATSHLGTLDWSDVTPANHETFYQGVLHRCNEFKKVFEIIREANEVPAADQRNRDPQCPSVDQRKFGLAKVFLRMFDQKYNDAICSELGKLSDYRKITTFVAAYLAQARAHYELSKEITKIPYTHPAFRKPTGQKPKKPTVKFKPRPSPNRKVQAEEEELNHIPDWYSDRENLMSDSNSEGRDDTSAASPREDAFYPGDEEDSIASVTSADEVDALVNAMANENAKSSDRPPHCAYHAIYGQCLLKDCKYKQYHSMQYSNAARKYFTERWQGNGNSGSDLKKPKPHDKTFAKRPPDRPGLKPRS